MMIDQMEWISQQDQTLEDPLEAQNLMEELFDAEMELSLRDIPAFDRPFAAKVNTDFHEHQKNGIRILLHRELCPRQNPFFFTRCLKNGATAYYDRVTRKRLLQPYDTIKGTILADDMGLGKTLQTLSLFLLNPPRCTRICSLIVCPKSVISNWMDQVDTFFEPGTFTVQEYAGEPRKRSRILQEVSSGKIDILIASYDIVAREFGAKNGGIQLIKFHRIVIDEAQHIRNRRTKKFKAVMTVAENSDYRLALTGTPMVNRPDDLFALMAFAGIRPWTEWNVFKEKIADPIFRLERVGLSRIRGALAYGSIRRTKNTLNVASGIVCISILEKAVEFPDGLHKDTYAVLNKLGRTLLEVCCDEKGAGNLGWTLALRLRMSCNSGYLVVHQYNRAKFILESISGYKLSPAEGLFLLNAVLRSGDPSTSPSKLHDGQESPKVLALLNAIAQMGQEEKGVIFSQWTTVLSIIGDALDAAGHSNTRIDGAMTTRQRSEAIKSLNSGSSRFILCSLKAASEGINLTRANVVFIMDPWWNAETEKQAYNRVHRIGQTRSVRVYRFLMKGTVEEKMHQLQNAKSALGKGTTARLTREEETLARKVLMKDLFSFKSRDDAAESEDAWA